MICKQCGKEFEGRADAKYCSAACRQRTHRDIGDTGQSIPCLGRDELFELKNFSVPISARSGIYFLWDGDFIVYIGKSSEIVSRVGSHISEATKVFDAVSIVDVGDNTNLLAIEKAYIKKYAPRYNLNIVTEVERLKQQVSDLEMELSLRKGINPDNPDVGWFAEELYPATYAKRMAEGSEYRPT